MSELIFRCSIEPHQGKWKNKMARSENISFRLVCNLCDNDLISLIENLTTRCLLQVLVS